MKLSRRGLFGLSGGLGLAALLGRVKPKAETQPLMAVSGNELVTVSHTYTTVNASTDWIYFRYNYSSATSGSATWHASTGPITIG